MAIRKSVEEVIVVAGPREMWLNRCAQALQNSGFTKIGVNPGLFQVSGDYKKLSIWGEILIILLPEGPNTRLAVKSTANVDNVYALFKSPTKEIISKFKEGLR
jgi:hypothetical protein